MKDPGNYLSFPLDEAMHPWLSLLLEAYRITDAGVTEGIAREQRKGRSLACARGCAHCCRTHQDIPVYPIELAGISWYAVEQLQGDLRERLRARLAGEDAGDDACPFLLDESCSIHPLRPMACRLFNVFDRRCEAGEDAFHTRRQDVLTPIRKYKDSAMLATMPFYGQRKKSEYRKMVETGAAHRLARPLRECNWPAIAQRMLEHDRRKAP